MNEFTSEQVLSSNATSQMKRKAEEPDRVGTSSTATASSSKLPRGEDPASSDVLSLFECPVCMGHAIPPIFQCQAGHVVCTECRAKLQRCPNCRGSLGNSRNLMMEKLAERVMFPCRYQFRGCKEAFRYPDKKEHETECRFRSFDCPLEGSNCRWQGALDQVTSHLTDRHKISLRHNNESLSISISNSAQAGGIVSHSALMTCFGHQFLVVINKQGHHACTHWPVLRAADGVAIRSLVQLIGPQAEADQFRYRIDLKDRLGRRLLWEATPLSICQSHQTAFDRRDCLELSSKTGALFTRNGKIHISVTISRRAANE